MRAYIAVPASGVYSYTGAPVLVGETLRSSFLAVSGLHTTHFIVFRSIGALREHYLPHLPSPYTVYEMEVDDDQVTGRFSFALLVRSARVLRQLPLP